jgi:hypothetical protein
MGRIGELVRANNGVPSLQSDGEKNANGLFADQRLGFEELQIEPKRSEIADGGRA